MYRVLLSSVLLAVMFSAGSAVSQQCGDFDGDANVDVGDLVKLVRYLSDTAALAPADSLQMELDGRIGITVGDLVELTQFLILGGKAPTCGASMPYGIDSTLQDSLLMPTLTDIGADVNQVTLPIRATLIDGTEGLSAPLLVLAEGSTSHFAFDSATHGTSSMLLFNSIAPGADSGLLIAVRKTDAQVSGTAILNLHYTRVKPGDAKIVTAMTDDPEWQRLVVVRGADLLRPMVAKQTVTGQARTVISID